MEQQAIIHRIEKVREYVDDVLLHMADTEEKRCAYIHLYIYSYKTMDRCDHAHQGAVMAKEILEELGIFTGLEIDMICDAIYHHSDKAKMHTPFVEVLMDADVLQHYLYNPFFTVSGHAERRLEKLQKEFGL